VLLDDSFTADRAWAERQEEDFRFYYADGGYRIFNALFSVQVSSVRSFTLDDAYLETAARLSSGEQNAYFGPVCRWQNLGNYYGFGVNASGGYAIYRLQNGRVTFLAQGQDDQGRLRTGLDENRIAALCSGNTLTLVVNDQLLLEVQDSTFSQGQVGLGTLTQSGASEAHFENFILVRP
jgi:hypothetical protein